MAKLSPWSNTKASKRWSLNQRRYHQHRASMQHRMAKTNSTYPRITSSRFYRWHSCLLLKVTKIWLQAKTIKSIQTHPFTKYTRSIKFSLAMTSECSQRSRYMMLWLMEAHQCKKMLSSYKTSVIIIIGKTLIPVSVIIKEITKVMKIEID